MAQVNHWPRQWGVGTIIGLLLLVCPTILAQDDTTDCNQKTTLRLEASRRAVEKISAYRLDQGTRVPLELEPGPLTSFQALVAYTDGTSWVWGNNGRPQAFLSLSVIGNGRWIYEFISLTNEPLLFDTGHGAQWTPESDWDPQPLSNAPVPADDMRRRMTQLKALAQRFSGHQIDYNRKKDGDRSQLRLLPQPVYRYPAGAGETIDGALFLLCLDINPEVLLVIEARQQANSDRHWQFACRRVTSNRVIIELDGENVWERMNIDWNSASSKNSYWIYQRPLEPGVP